MQIDNLLQPRYHFLSAADICWPDWDCACPSDGAKPSDKNN